MCTVGALYDRYEDETHRMMISAQGRINMSLLSAGEPADRYS